MCDSNYFSNDDNVRKIQALARVPVPATARYQIFAIDPATRREAEASTSNGSVSVSQAEWDAAQHAVVNNTRLPPGVSPGTLNAYHSILERNRVRLATQEAERERRKQAADASSQRRAELSALPSVGSHSRSSKYHPRIPRLSERDVADIKQNLNSSFMTMYSAGLMRPKIAEGAAVQLAAYLVGNPPIPDDPRSALHRVAIDSLGILGDRLTPKAPAGADRSPRHISGSRRRHSRSPDKSPWHGSGSRRHSPTKDLHDDIT